MPNGTTTSSSTVLTLLTVARRNRDGRAMCRVKCQLCGRTKLHHQPHQIMRVCDAPIPNGERNKMPVFNAYIATSHRTSRRQKEDSAATAGTAKIPRVGVNKSDLEAQGTQYGWTARPLTYQEVRRMPSSELRWHEQFNAANLENALASPAKIKEGKDIDRQWAVRRMWEGRATAEEDEKARIAGDAFATRTPQFARTIENATLMIEHMKARDWDATKIESYVAAFRELTEQGKLTVAPAQSADEFLAAHPELHDTRTPPIIEARHQREQNTEALAAKSVAATSEGNVARLVDYGPRRHGVPEPEKYSFKQKIRSMSASEIAQRCQDDLAFRKALDELK
jgi:hypothetical protein